MPRGASPGCSTSDPCRTSRPSDWAERLDDAADEYVAVETHSRFGAVGLFYSDFSQTTDDEVIECLRWVAEQRSSAVPEGSRSLPPQGDDVLVDGAELERLVHVPEKAVGLVVLNSARPWQSTLLIVGSCDERVLTLNQEAQDHLRCESKLVIVPGATHLFEEPGALTVVAELARDWFLHQFHG